MVALAAPREWLDFMILDVFSNPNDSMILLETISDSALLLIPYVAYEGRKGSN